MDFNLDYTLEFLEEIINISSPSGDTKEVMDRVEREFKELGLNWKKTKKGASYAVLEGENTKESILLTAHVDTLGAMVKEIKSNGRLKMSKIGGYSWGAVEGENVNIKTTEGKIFTGTILPEESSVHIFDNINDFKKTDDSMEIRIDEKTTSPEETRELGIEVGDFVSFFPRFILTENGYIKSRHIDDKACVSVLLSVCKYFLENNLKPKYTTYFYVADYEEIGHGLYFIPENIKEIVAVDIGTVGGSHRSLERAVTIMAKDGVTPYDLELKNKFVKLSKENEINYRIDISKNYGSDASTALRQGNDVRVGCIGPGVDSTHHYERTHREALESTIKLVSRYLLSE